MSEEATPGWQIHWPPKVCEKCGIAYSGEELFESMNIDTDIEIFDRQYRTWCKNCEAIYLEAGEAT